MTSKLIKMVFCDKISNSTIVKKVHEYDCLTVSGWHWQRVARCWPINATIMRCFEILYRVRMQPDMTGFSVFIVATCQWVIYHSSSVYGWCSSYTTCYSLALCQRGYQAACNLYLLVLCIVTCGLPILMPSELLVERELRCAVQCLAYLHYSTTVQNAHSSTRGLPKRLNAPLSSSGISHHTNSFPWPDSNIMSGVIDTVYRYSGMK